MSEQIKKLAERLSGWKTVILVAVVGLVLLLWPSGSTSSDKSESADARTEETRVEALLSKIEGVGEVYVLLSDEGAAVVCQGAGDATVRLAVKEAVRSYTGLLSSEITVFKMN